MQWRDRRALEARLHRPMQASSNKSHGGRTKSIKRFSFTHGRIDSFVVRWPIITTTRVQFAGRPTCLLRCCFAHIHRTVEFEALWVQIGQDLEQNQLELDFVLGGWMRYRPVESELNGLQESVYFFNSNPFVRRHWQGGS